MQLLHLKYKDGRLFLLLSIGERNGKCCGIISQNVTDRDRSKIIDKLAYLSKASLVDRLKWLKTNCPSSLKKGYREIHTANITIIGTYQITSRI